MEFASISEASRYGMNFERARLEAASQNLAVANVAYATATEAAQAANELSNALFSKLVGVEAGSQNSSLSVKEVLDPGHPLSNTEGKVFYIDVDPVREMTNLVSAIRAYEANVRAYNTSGDMNNAALSIGSNR